MEPRARASRHKSTLNFSEDLIDLLHGSGAPTHPDLTHPLPDGSSQRYLTRLPTENRSHAPTPFSKPQTGVGADPNTPKPIPYPETLRVLDEIVTDYIIETSHAALEIASYSGRAKVKLADFEFVLRRDRKKLGRAQEMRRKAKRIQEERKGAEDAVGAVDIKKMAVKNLQELGDFVGEEGTGKGKGKGRGRRKKRTAEEAGLEAAPTSMSGAVKSGSGDGGHADGANGGGTAEDLGDVDVDIDNDLEEAREDDDRHKNKRARGEVN